jgi:hypothetical protein
MQEERERLKLDYEQTLATYSQLAEITFKLLAFVPTISGAAIALLTQTSIEPWVKLVLAGMIVRTYLRGDFRAGRALSVTFGVRVPGF